MAKKQTPRFWIVFILFAALTPMVVAKLGEWTERKQESEVRTQLASLLTAEKAYFKEYGAYSPDLSKIGFSLEGKLTCKPVLQKEEIPAAELSDWPEECLPVVSKDSFRAACMTGRQKGRICFTMDEMGVFKKRKLFQVKE